MTTHPSFLWGIASQLLTAAQVAELRPIATTRPLNYEQFILFDHTLGGPNMLNVSRNGLGRYAPDDRDVFRPLQYCQMYFELVAEESRAEWLTRELVHMSSLHVEGLVKLITGTPRLPLGNALQQPRAKSTINPMLWGQIDRFRSVYNNAKHSMNHPVDTHMFTVEDAVVSYIICRRFALMLYPYVRLATDLSMFDKS